MKVFFKVIKYLFIILALLVFVVFLFVNISPQFGDSPDKNSKNVIEKSKNFIGNEFVNLDPVTVNTKSVNSTNEKSPSLMDWISPAKGKNPSKSLPSIKFQSDNLTAGKFVWLGHSTILINIGGLIVMTDPVFNRASPIPVFGKPFPIENPITINDLPDVDVVVISHDHYDHLDTKAIKILSKKVNHFFVPLGVKAHLVSWGVDSKKVSELDWYDEKKYNDVNFILTPAQHFSGRGITNRNSTLWGSWVISSNTLKVYHSGDSGYSDSFKKIGEKFGPFDIAFIENGGYHADWSKIHMFPDEVVQSSIDLKAKVFVPISWSKFDLSVHTWDDPIIRATEVAKNRNVNISTPMIGEIFDLNNLPTVHWWKVLRNKL